MGGGKETPRQKMIGMMYLVLLALLAMNVSKSIIQAFITLNSKMEASVEPVLIYNSGMTDELDNKISNPLSALEKCNIITNDDHKNI